jgi:hypothetical protein
LEAYSFFYPNFTAKAIHSLPAINGGARSLRWCDVEHGGHGGAVRILFRRGNSRDGSAAMCVDPGGAGADAMAFNAWGL